MPRPNPNGTPWPPPFRMFLTIWNDLTGLRRQPDSCLINYYASDAKMGLHQTGTRPDFPLACRVINLVGDEEIAARWRAKTRRQTAAFGCNQGMSFVMEARRA